MPFVGKQLDSITQSDLQDLIDNHVSERKTIEYKESLPGGSDHDKREFIADVSSFANAAGGHLIYGMKEEAGVPTALCGLETADPDAAILRLESLMRDCIEPRIPGISSRAVPLTSSKAAIIVRIPKSWASPHVVKFQNHWRFYSRTSNGKYPLDVSEVRALFVASETLTERIRDFRVERLARIVAGETPASLGEGAKIVLHVVPLSAFEPRASLDITSFASGPEYIQAKASWGSHNGQYNFDGFLSYSDVSYLQVFRNGSIEAVETGLLSGYNTIPSVTYEDRLLQSLPTFLQLQKRIGVEPPLFVMLSLLGVAGYTMGVKSRYRQPAAHAIDRDQLVVQETMVESFNDDCSEILRPAFDAIWNAAGWPGSIYYDAGGQWVGH